MTTDTKHTPGKWAVKPLDDTAIVHENQGFLVTDDEDNRIAVVVNEDVIDIEMFEANARLISHAPELLEALEKSVIELCEHCPSDFIEKYRKHCKLCENIARYKQLIARAKGGKNDNVHLSELR